MTIFWQKMNLATNKKIGEPEPLPQFLVGLENASLASLAWTEDVKLKSVGYVPVEMFDIPALIKDKLRQLNAKYEEVFGKGFAYNFKGKPEVLQMRQTDLINWLVFKDSCDDMIAAGYGDQVAQLRIRVTSNATYEVTAKEGRACMIAMRIHGSTLLGILWAKKDKIEALTTKDEIDAIDINEGWN